MRRAVYPGSFDPVTYGHLDIIKRAAKAFEELTVLVMNNSAKNPLFSASQRAKMIEEVTKDIPNVKVEVYDRLLVEYAAKNDIHVSVRGLRAVTDFEYELQIAQINKKFSDGKLDTVFFTTSLEYAYLSSSVVKEIAYYGGNIEACVPPNVLDAINEKYAQK